MRIPACFTIAAFVASMLLLAPASGARADGTAGYQPAPPDEVVIYTHRFKAEEFEKGVQRVEEGFTQAQKALGQTRLNYFLVNPANYEVVVVSFFSKETSVEAWHKYVGRLDLLKELEPMRREPLILQRFQVHAVTMTAK
jgi:hypothetical protein